MIMPVPAPTSVVMVTTPGSTAARIAGMSASLASPPLAATTSRVVVWAGDTSWLTPRATAAPISAPTSPKARGPATRERRPGVALRPDAAR